jgi:hypothetical protein
MKIVVSLGKSFPVKEVGEASAREKSIRCHEFAWLRYLYLDREHNIIYGLQLVQEP